MAKAPPLGEGEERPPVIVKKYANRRLYNTETSSYITLDHLAKLTRDGREFKVLDAKSDEDITHSVLTQIIMDEEGKGATMLPPAFLRQLIAMYGDSMQSMVPHYLEASMDAFRTNQAKFQDALNGAMQGAFAGGPFADIAKRNLAMFEAATASLSGALVPKPREDGDEVAGLKAQIAALQAKVDRLGS